jgi:DNA sulfur modification protein DndD
MIFERLTLHNFQRYGGTSTIEFPTTDDHSLVVLLAPNNTGKTTILRAIEFLFYGTLGGETRETAWKIVTDIVRDETPPGNEVTAWVEARVQLPNDETCTIRRQIAARRPTPSQWKAEALELLWKKTDNPKEAFIPDDGHLQVKIDNAVPPDLFSWFYFHGEPAKGKMGHGANIGVLEPLKKVLQLRRWRDARTNLDAVVKSLRQQEEKEAGANRAFIEARKREDVVRRSLAENRIALNELKKALSELERSKLSLEAEMTEVSSKARESEELHGQLSKHRLGEQKAQQALKAADTQLCDLIRSSLGVTLLTPAFPPVNRHLSALRDRNLLPADVSRGFIERLLKGTTCVCGSCLDDGKKKELENYLGKTLAAQTNRDLVSLADALEGGNDSPLSRRAAAFPGQVSRLKAEKSAAATDLSSARTAIEGISPKIENSSITRFRELYEALRKTEREIKDNERAQAEKTQSIRIQEASLTNLAAEINKARPKRGADKMEGISKAIALGEKVREKLSDGETAFRQAVHGILQERLNHYFGAATSGNTAWIDRETFLPSMRDRSGLIVTNPGGGEQQVLHLAFVIALAELRTAINEDMKSAGLGGRLLGDQSFVLDSPFTSADPNFMKAIAEFLPGKAPQMLLLLAKQNWPDSVRETLAPHITRGYGVKLHTPVAPNDPEAFRFPLAAVEFLVQAE